MSPKKPKTRQELERDLRSLDNRRVRGEISAGEYDREYSHVLAQLPKAQPSIYMGGATEYSIGYTTETTLNPMTADDWDELRKYMVKNPLEITMTGVFGGYIQYGFLGGSGNKSVAEQAWEEHGGVVTCECESLDCIRVIEITKEEYLHASTPGYRRLTHPDCPYGIVNSRLMERKPGWSVWDKGW